MLVSTDNLEFGVLLSPSDRPRFWTLLLLLNDELIGDSTPCMVGSAIPIIAQRPPFLLVDPQLEPTAILASLRSEANNDVTLRPLAESFDDWEVRFYATDREAVVVASPGGSDRGLRQVRRAAVPIGQYMDVVGTVANYWRSSSS